MNTAICAAILKRAVVEFTYEGRTRMVEPYAHGISAAGNEVLRGYQTGGASQSGEPVAWKLFAVAEIINFRETRDTFTQSQLGYNPNDRGMSTVHCHV
ncbi:MAG: hypothetical protein BMS9Abin28_2366 [Anaerolineae bacterium]|nr:MAG: hypothetical protein BMS9Abin28_2366 [Anaerolineae bacterium]